MDTPSVGHIVEPNRLLLVAASLNGTTLPVAARCDSRPSLPTGQPLGVLYLCKNASGSLNADASWCLKEADS